MLETEVTVSAKEWIRLKKTDSQWKQIETCVMSWWNDQSQNPNHILWDIVMIMRLKND